MEQSPLEKDVPPPPKKPRARRPAKPPFDLEDLYQSTTFQSRELPEERDFRLRVEEKRVEHEHWKEKLLLIAVLAGLATIGVLCLVVALIPGPSEEKKWAMSVLASIVFSGLGYLGGRASKPD